MFCLKEYSLEDDSLIGTTWYEDTHHVHEIYYAILRQGNVRPEITEVDHDETGFVYEIMIKKPGYQQPASLKVALSMIKDVLSEHPFLAWNENTKQLEEIQSVCINGSALQFNIKKGD